MFERSFRSALELSRNGYLIFVTRPICIVLLVLIVMVILWPLVQKKIIEKRRAVKAE